MSNRDVDRDPGKLHPVFRQAAAEVLRACAEQGLPFELFEGYRTPRRQHHLFLQGRSDRYPGPILTHNDAWYSFHQFGLSADFILRIGGKWTWHSREHDYLWERLREIGAMYELEGNDENGHLHMAGLEIERLRAGSYPGGGDATWESNLREILVQFPISEISDSNLRTRSA